MTETERPPSRAPEAASPEEELRERFVAAYDERGVDRSLIRWCLAQTVTDRVRAVEETLNALATVRRLLSLPRLIEVKRKLHRPKDQLALLQLEAALEERGR